MAGAAAKKSAAARKAAQASYFPVFAAINIGYILLRLVSVSGFASLKSVAASLALVGLSFMSYRGIIDDHANTMPKRTGSSDKLAGGASLDLLGLTTIVQYGTIFVHQFYWLLAVIPLWGGYKLYTTFFGSGAANDFTGSGSVNNEIDQDLVDKAAARKQKRAERRRQKWS